MGSSRLPGKVLMPLAGRAMILHVIDRLSEVAGIDRVVAAIPNAAEDDPLNALLESAGISTVRGPLDDVLHRYVLAATRAGAETIVRVTADCPLISPRVCERVVRAFHDAPGVDYASNTINRTWPRGLDTEVFTSAALLEADRESTDPVEREHVTPFIYRRPNRYRLLHVSGEIDRSSLRWTVDTMDDYRFAAAVYDLLGVNQQSFDLPDVLSLLGSHPELITLNEHVVQKSLGE
jgi:spore coat polysaccharide biosynthesis protein SpsF